MLQLLMEKTAEETQEYLKLNTLEINFRKQRELTCKISMEKSVKENVRIQGVYGIGEKFLMFIGKH